MTMKSILIFFALVASLVAAPRLVPSDLPLRPTSTLELIFDEAMVPQATVGQKLENDLVTIEPAWEMDIIWRSRNLARLVPKAAPGIGASYQFTLNLGLKTETGAEVKAPVFQKLLAGSFTVTRTIRKSSVRTGGMVLIFNDRVAAQAVGPFFQFISPETKEQKAQMIAARTRQATWGDITSRSYYSAPWDEQFAGVKSNNERPDSDILSNAIVVEPVSPLPIGTGWSLNRLAGLPNLVNSVSINSANAYQIGNVIPFEIRSVSARAVVDGEREISMSFNQSLPIDLKEEQVLSLIRVVPAPKDLKASFDYRRQTITLSGGLAEKDAYTVTIPRVLSSADGLALGKDYQKQLKFVRVQPKVVLPSFDQSQLASGTRTYEISSLNNQSIHLSIKRLAPDDLIRASQGYRHYTGDGAEGKRLKTTGPLPFVLIGGETVFDGEIKLEAALDTTAKHVIHWDKFLPEGQRFGAFFVAVTGEPAKHPDLPRSPSVLSQSLVQLTDLGLAWKLTNDKAFIYAYSCQTGLPLPNVELSLFGEDAQSLAKVITNASGVATLPRGEQFRHLRASLKGDAIVLPYDDSLPEVSMWRFPVNFSWQESSAQLRDAFMFTDRNLYRPGETLRLKGLVRGRDGDELKVPLKETPRLTLSDPSGREIFTDEITLSERGAFDFEYQLPAVTVGRYRIALTWPKELEALAELDNWWDRSAGEQSASFQHSFNVQEFKRNTFEEEATLVETPEHDLAYNLGVQYFQGTPVALAKADWYLSARSTGIYPDKFRDFLFGNHRQYDSRYWSHYFGYTAEEEDSSNSGNHNQSGEASLDDSGKLALNFKIPPIEYPMPRTVSVLTEITDANSQTLSSNSSVTVHSSDFYLGISRQDSLTRVGEEVPFKLVAVNQDGETFAQDVEVKVQITREDNTQVKSKAANGAVVVKNEKSEVPVREVVVTIPAGSKGFDLPFKAADSGAHTFTLTSSDAAARAVKTVSTIQVYGSKDYPWAYESGMRIKLVPEQRRYQPGDTARILVLSPIEGEALVSLERRGVLRHFRTRLTLDNPVIEIPLTNEDAPNAFVSVLIIKGAADSKRKNPEPQLRLGYCELKVDPAADRLTIEMGATKSETRPGEAVQVNGRVIGFDGKPVPNAELVFYAEDEGTLSVTGYENPDPLSHFHAPRMLETRNGTSLENFIPETPGENYYANKGFIIGDGDSKGGDAEDAIALRKNFDPCAAWMPTLKTGADGQFTASFIAPDTLTRYRLIAVAHEGASRFGVGTGEAIVNKPLMLEPSPPLFAHEGDRLQPMAIVQNNSDHAGTWKVTLTLDSMTGAGAPDSPNQPGQLETFVTLEPRSQGAISFDVHFRNTGTARWVWTATPENVGDAVLRRSLSDAVESTFEVRYPMPLLTEVNFVSFNDSARKNNLLDGFSPNLLDGVGDFEVEFARSRLSEAGAAIDYLLHYPYGCVEQTTSSTIPWIAAKNLRHLAPGFQKKSEEQITKAIQRGADRLISMQTRDGGLGYWPGADSSLPWASSYGGLGLILCRDAGANVPQQTLDDLAGYLSKQLRDLTKVKSSYDLEGLTRSMYVLARLGKTEAAYHSKLLERVDELSTTARSFLALAMHAAGEPGAIDLMNLAPMKQKATGYWMAYRPDDAVKLLAWATISPTADECETTLASLLKTRSKRGHWRTTWCNAWSLLAMGAYAEAVEKDVKDITIKLVTAEGEQTIVIPADTASKTVKMPIHGGFVATASSSDRVFAHTSLSAKPRIQPITPVSRSGVTVNRIYERVKSDGSTEPLTNPQIGDLVKVSLEVNLPRDDFRYLAIDDPLPSSFQAINTEFRSQAGRVKKENSWRISNREIRSDRVLTFVDYPGRSGSYVTSYHARVTHAGEIYVPPTKVEEMYDPENYALGASEHLSVK